MKRRNIHNSFVEGHKVIVSGEIGTIAKQDGNVYAVYGFLNSKAMQLRHPDDVVKISHNYLGVTENKVKNALVVESLRRKRWEEKGRR